MTPERWQELKGRVKDSFPGVEERAAPLETGPGQLETLVFSTPAGRMKLECILKPRTLGERGMVSKRIGATVHIEKIYSATEQVAIFKAYRQSPNGDWTEISPDAIP